jgi:hypothetical protein
VVTVLNQTDALVLLNAFRMGVVPGPILDGNIHRKPISDRLNLFIKDLKSNKTNALLIKGEYGSGKSHTLSHFRYEAIKSGFVVSQITVDQGFRLSRLDELYHEIMHNLYANDASKIASFEDLFGIWIDNLRTSPDRSLASHQIKFVIDEMNRHHDSFSRAFLGYIRASLVNDTTKAHVCAAWLRGDKNIPATAKRDFGIVGAIDQKTAFHFIKAFSHLITLLGHKGLILMIDELDLVRHLRADSRIATYSTLREMIDFQFGGSLGNFGIILAGTPEFFFDETTGVASHVPLAERFGIDGVKLNHEALIFDIATLTPDDLYTISSRLMEIYQRAYDQMTMPQFENACHLVLMDMKKDKIAFSSITIRKFIQNFIALLDNMRKHPHQKIYQSHITFKLSDQGEMIFKNRL